MHSANKRRRYIVPLSLIGWAHTQTDPWICYHRFSLRLSGKRCLFCIGAIEFGHKGWHLHMLVMRIRGRNIFLGLKNRSRPESYRFKVNVYCSQCVVIMHLEAIGQGPFYIFGWGRSRHFLWTVFGGHISGHATTCFWISLNNGG